MIKPKESDESRIPQTVGSCSAVCMQQKSSRGVPVVPEYAETAYLFL